MCGRRWAWGRGGGCPVTRRDIFVSREELAPLRGGVPGARLRQSVGCPGGVEPRRARVPGSEELGVFSRGNDRTGGGVAQSEPQRAEDAQAETCDPGSCCSKSPGEPAPATSPLRLPSERDARGVESQSGSRPGPGGLVGPGEVVPRRTRANFGRGARMWGGDPSPVLAAGGAPKPGWPGPGVGGVGWGWDLDCFGVATCALPVRHLLRGRGYFCPPARRSGREGARWSAALSLGAGRRAVPGSPKPSRGG